jgi:hypothetical protein
MTSKGRSGKIDISKVLSKELITAINQSRLLDEFPE